MAEYVLGHDLKGEGKRLALMSELLDPMHRRYLQSLDVVKSGARTGSRLRQRLNFRVARPGGCSGWTSHSR
jgi:hypothetical protein